MMVIEAFFLLQFNDNLTPNGSVGLFLALQPIGL
jgi:hypothetical protein